MTFIIKKQLLLLLLFVLAINNCDVKNVIEKDYKNQMNYTEVEYVKAFTKKAFFAENVIY